MLAELISPADPVVARERESERGRRLGRASERLKVSKKGDGCVKSKAGRNYFGSRRGRGAGAAGEEQRDNQLKPQQLGH